MLDVFIRTKFVLAALLTATFFNVSAQQTGTQPAPTDEVEDSVSLQWFWQNEYGRQQELNVYFGKELVKQGYGDKQKINYTLSYPVQALHTYLGPRLIHVMRTINQYSPQSATKFVNLEHAFSTRDKSPESEMFWQAYYQYQDDAFNFLKVSPCINQEDNSIPCVRPNYSQIFYDYREAFRAIAEQLKSSEGQPASISNAQHWVFTIPQAEEHLSSFAPPISVLRENAADSDEKALLLATLISQLAPDYRMYLIYPANSNGSVSPAWLTIESKSGANGVPVVINDTPHTLISGSPSLLKQMMVSETKMVSESLY